MGLRSDNKTASYYNSVSYLPARLTFCRQTDDEALIRGASFLHTVLHFSIVAQLAVTVTISLADPSGGTLKLVNVNLVLTPPAHSNTALYHKARDRSYVSRDSWVIPKTL